MSYDKTKSKQSTCLQWLGGFSSSSSAPGSPRLSRNPADLLESVARSHPAAGLNLDNSRSLNGITGWIEVVAAHSFCENCRPRCRFFRHSARFPWLLAIPTERADSQSGRLLIRSAEKHEQEWSQQVDRHVPWFCDRGILNGSFWTSKSRARLRKNDALEIEPDYSRKRLPEWRAKNLTGSPQRSLRRLSFGNCS